MLGLVIEKFDKYWHKMDAENTPNFNQDLASEIRKRLEQLDYLYKIIIEKHGRYMELSWKEFGGDLNSYKEKIRAAGGSIIEPKTEEKIEMDKLALEMNFLLRVFII